MPCLHSETEAVVLEVLSTCATNIGDLQGDQVMEPREFVGSFDSHLSCILRIRWCRGNLDLCLTLTNLTCDRPSTVDLSLSLLLVQGKLTINGELI